MLKTIYGVVAGFVVWSILWVLSGAFFTLIAPEWYGVGIKSGAVLPLILTLLTSFVISIGAGWTAVLVAKRNSPMLTALVLSFLLLFVGVGVQAANWNVVPWWFQLIFVAGLIPLTLLGAKLRGA